MYASARLNLFVVFGLLVHGLCAGELQRGKSVDTCGVYALSKSLGVIGKPVPDWDVLVDKLLETRNGIRGTSLRRLYEVAEEFGANPEARKMTFEEMIRIANPAILFVDGKHFVVAGGFDLANGRILLLDEGRPPEWKRQEDLAGRWTGECMVLNSPTELRADPALWLESERFRLGSLNGSPSQVRDIPVRNLGSSPLRISNLSLEPGIGSARMEPESIPPGEWGLIKMSIDSSRVPDGPLKAELSMSSNDPRSPHSKIQMDGLVSRTMRIVPIAMDVGVIYPTDDPILVEYEVDFGHDEQRVVTGDNADPVFRWISTEFRPDLHRMVVKCELEPGKLKLGSSSRFMATTLLQTDDYAYKKLRLAVTGELRPLLATSPMAVYVDDAPGDGTIVETVKLVGPLAAKAAVAAIEPEGAMSATISGDVLRIEISREAASRVAHVTLRADDQEYKVPVVVIFP